MSQRPSEKISALIADDAKEDRFLLKAAIAEHAPLIQIAGEVTDGAQVLEYLTGKGKYADRKEHPFPDLLFLDLRMPGVDGFAVLEWLQQHPLPYLKIVVRTDSSGIAYHSEAIALGAHYFFPKHSKLDELAGMLLKLQQDLLNDPERK